MKKLFLLPLLFVFLSANEMLKVGATPVPAAVMLEFAKPLLKERGIDLVVQHFTDFITPNLTLAKGDSDANLYQHKPFLDFSNQKNGWNLISLGKIYITPMGFYSVKYKKLSEFPIGAKIAVPNDPSNYSRSLLFLAEHGYIEIKNPQGKKLVSEFDISKNPRRLIFQQVDAATLPKIYKGVDGAVITGNYALQAGIDIAKDSLFHEAADSIYTNILATRPELENDARIKELKKVLQSDDMKNFVAQKYGGSIFLIQE